MTAITPVRAGSTPITDPTTARAHSEAEYTALVRLLDQLTHDDWARPTDCVGWTPREMVAHLAGAAEAAVRWRKTIKHNGIALIRARRGTLGVVDHLCASQIGERRHLDIPGLMADLRRWAALAPAKIEAKPGFIRRITLPPSAGLPVGATFGYLIDVINTRDVWLHRIDLARATGRTHTATPAEAEVVRQVMRDLDHQWAGDAIDVTLTGPGAARGGSATVSPWRACRRTPSPSCGFCPGAQTSAPSPSTGVPRSCRPSAPNGWSSDPRPSGAGNPHTLKRNSTALSCE